MYFVRSYFGKMQLWQVERFFLQQKGTIQVPFCEEKSVQLVRVAFFRSDFLQNPYFSVHLFNIGWTTKTFLAIFNFFGIGIWKLKCVDCNSDLIVSGPGPNVDLSVNFHTKYFCNTFKKNSWKCDVSWKKNVKL